MPKPKNKKKPFINKKNAVRFQLVHRSQQDPLAADEDAPQMVLQPMDKSQVWKAGKEEERKFGVFYDDDYNYLQHLKDRTVVEHDWSEADRFILESKNRKKAAEAAAMEAGSSGQDEAKGESNTVRMGNVSLPSHVFASKEEEDVGLLNRAAPRGLDLSLDPDIVAAMDDDFDFDDPDNELDDDFMMKAMGEGGDDDDDDEDEQDWESDDCDSGNERMGGGRSEDEEEDEVPELVPWQDFDEEETKTRFTNYSLSSSVIRRNNELSLLDDKFDKFMEQYGDMDEGALDGDEIEGVETEEGERMKALLAETEEDRKTQRQQIQREKEIANRLALIQSDDDEKEEVEEVEVKRESKWDCESILSTYSNLYNHPKLISEPSKAKREKPSQIQISAKSGLPLDTLGRGLTAAALRQLDQENREEKEADLKSMMSRVSQLSIRNKHETPEERKERKAAVKEYRRERRIEKKANKMAFKDEKVRQEKIFMNNKNNIQGNRIL